MNASRAPRSPLRLLAACAMLLPHLTLARAAGDLDGITAVVSRVSDDYVRAKLPDGSIQPEFYAFGEGGQWGGDISDATFDRLHFMDVARAIAEPLAGRKYLPARDPAKTRLLIMVYWGTTAVPMRPEENPLYANYQQSLAEYKMLISVDEGAADAVLSSGLTQLAMANRETDRIDCKNAAILGYESTGLIGTDYGKYIAHTALGVDQRDQVAEIEENRYFVVLMAYDFQLMWRERKHKLLWETRFSVSERHNQFDKALPAMAQYASRYFGQASNGLLRTRVPEGAVEVGEPRSLGEVEAPGKQGFRP